LTGHDAVIRQALLEARWIGWARRVLARDGELRRCAVCTETGSTPFDQVLWPGYIGARYSEGLVVIVGAVHNAEELQTREMENLAKFAKDWALGKLSSDREYLDCLRAAYLTSAKCSWIRTGQVWKHFQTLLNKLGLCWEQVAFTNWNKCKSRTSIDPQKRSALYNKHISASEDLFERLPIKELSPLVVFICCGNRTVVREVRKHPLQTPIIRVYNQRGFRSKYRGDELYQKWLDADARAYRINQTGEPGAE
jgi:hypothetical protein